MTVTVLKVSQILDKHTLIASGNPEMLVDGYLMYVLGESGFLPDGSPIVVPKAELRITAIAPTYVVLSHEGRTQEKEVEVPKFPGLEGFSLTRKEKIKVQVKEGLNVEDFSVSGNPGSRPVRVGDNVIHASDYAAYVRERTKSPEGKGAT